MDFFRTSKSKNDINHIKYQFSHTFGKFYRWLNMYYSHIRILIFFKVITMSIWIILKNVVWIHRECIFYYFWAIEPCIHPYAHFLAISLKPFTCVLKNFFCFLMGVLQMFHFVHNLWVTFHSPLWCKKLINDHANEHLGLPICCNGTNCFFFFWILKFKITISWMFYLLQKLVKCMVIPFFIFPLLWFHVFTLHQIMQRKNGNLCFTFIFNNWWYYSYTCVEINFPLVGNPIKGIKIIQIIQTTFKFEFSIHKFQNFVNKNHTRNITMTIQSLLVHTWHPIANY